LEEGNVIKVALASFNLFRHAQMLVADRCTAAGIADKGQLFHFVAAKMPCVGDEGTAPVTFFIGVCERHTHVSMFTHFFSACRACIGSHIEPPYKMLI
jgi:hypothetical protein